MEILTIALACLVVLSIGPAVISYYKRAERLWNRYSRLTVKKVVAYAAHTCAGYNTYNGKGYPEVMDSSIALSEAVMKLVAHDPRRAKQLLNDLVTNYDSDLDYLNAEGSSVASFVHALVIFSGVFQKMVEIRVPDYEGLIRRRKEIVREEEREAALESLA